MLKMFGNLSRSCILMHVRQSQKLYALLSAAAAPLCLSISALSLYCTIFIFISLAIVLLYMRYSLFKSPSKERDRSKSHFFIIWMISSVAFLICIFHIFVISLLEILLEENLVVVFLATVSIACLYNAKQKANQSSQMMYPNDVESSPNDKKILKTSNYCIQCQESFPMDYRHCIWLDCCIGSDNNKLFSWGVFFGMAALFYGSNLTLTTVCHPFIFYKTILLPDDCSDVYYNYEMALCFVCGLYSLIIAVLMLLFFIKKSLIWLKNFSGDSTYVLHMSSGVIA